MNIALTPKRVVNRFGTTVQSQCKRYYANESRDVARILSIRTNQPDIARVAKEKSQRLTTGTIIFAGDARRHRDRYLISTGQYLHRELPVRIAHRIESFHSLPFIIGCNPKILRVLESHVRSFQSLFHFPKIETMGQVKEYSILLERLLNDHKEDVNDMAVGFRESHKHLSEEMIESQLEQKFLDRMLKSRLAMRLLAMHYVLLHKEEDHHIGIIDKRFYPAKCIRKWTNFVTPMCQHEYGKAPRVKICGHTQARFPYIPMPLDYIVCEMLKNAMRFSVEHHPSSHGGSIPDVVVTIVSNNTDFIIKVSDRGGGIPHDYVDKVLEYNFTTVDEAPAKRTLNFLDDVMKLANSGPEGRSKMHGHGFGLPMSKCYAEFMGGSLMFQSMQGYGTEVYLRLKRIDKEAETIRF